jgi:hypothetical protein
MYKYLILALLGFHSISAQNTPKKKANNQKTDLKIVTLDPGHFHAALVQKTDLKFNLLVNNSQLSLWQISDSAKYHH